MQRERRESVKKSATGRRRFPPGGSAQKQRKSRSHAGKWLIHAANSEPDQIVRGRIRQPGNNRICFGFQRNLHSQPRARTMEAGSFLPQLWARRRGLEPEALAQFRPMGPGRYRPVRRCPCQPRHPRVLAPACVGTIYGPGRCRSSVVEHSLGKGEVVGSIPTGSTSFSSARSAFSGMLLSFPCLAVAL